MLNIVYFIIENAYLRFQKNTLNIFLNFRKLKKEETNY